MASDIFAKIGDIEGPTKRVLVKPQADYTRELLAAIPRPPS
jgi:ABC-type dipeptide/oligopeptide/nickel transport system ATPase component